MGPKKKNKGKQKWQPARNSNPGPFRARHMYFRSSFQAAIGTNDEAIAAAEQYWTLLAGRTKPEFVYLEDIINHPEKRPRIMKVCKTNMFVADAEEEDEIWKAAYMCLRLFVDPFLHDRIFTMLDAFCDKELESKRAVVLEHYPHVHNQIFIEKTIEFYWFEIMLRRGLQEIEDQWLSIWSMDRCMMIMAMPRREMEATIGKFTEDFFVQEVIPRLDKRDMFWRLLRFDHLRVFCNHLELACSQYITTTDEMQLALKYLKVYCCPNVLFNVVYALRNYPRRQLLEGQDDLKLVREVITSCRDFRYPMMRVIAIETLVMLTAKTFVLNSEILMMMADSIALISPLVKPQYVTRIFADIKNHLEASEEFKKMPFERKVAGLIRTLDTESYAERSKLYWAVASMDMGILMKEMKRVHEQMHTALMTPEDETISGLPQLFSLYYERPHKHGNLLQEHAGQAMKKILKNCFLENRGYKNELCAARTILRRIIFEYTPRQTIYEIIKELFKMIPQKQIQCQPIYMIFLDALIDTQMFEKDKWNDIVKRFDQYMGKTMLDKFKRPLIVRQWTLSDQQLAELGNVFHAIRIVLYLKIRPDILDWNDAGTACLSVIKFPTTEWRARERLLRLMYFFIAKHEKPLVALEDCAKVVDQETTNMLDAWKNFVHLPLLVLRIMKKDDEEGRRQCVRYLLEPIERALGISNWDPRLGLIIATAVEEEMMVQKKPDVLLVEVIVELACWFPGDAYSPDHHSEEFKEYSAMYYNYITMVEHGILTKNDEMERANDAVGTTRLKMILLCLHLLEHKEGWIDPILDAIFLYTKRFYGLQYAKRRSIQLLLCIVDYIPSTKNNYLIGNCFELLADHALEDYARILLEWFLARISFRSKSFFNAIRSATSTISQSGLTPLGIDRQFEFAEANRISTSIVRMVATIRQTMARKKAAEAGQEIEEYPLETGPPKKAEAEVEEEEDEDEDEEEEDEDEEEEEDENEEEDEEEEEEEESSGEGTSEQRKEGAGGTEGTEGGEAMEVDQSAPQPSENPAIQINAPVSFDIITKRLDYERHFSLEMILWELPKAEGIAYFDLIEPQVIGGVCAGRIMQIPAYCDDYMFIAHLWLSRANVIQNDLG